MVLMQRVIDRLVIGVVVGFMTGSLGCAVPQKPGNGRVSREVEPTTQTAYYLYLPEDYVANNGRHPQKERWPVVVTFHGLKPYDNAGPQIREWQEEADRYGFIVVAPDLRTCDSLTMQLPLRDPTLWYVRKDEQAVMAILDEVFRRTNADPERVLATSFSSGGYVAHYLVNRYPERFSCIAVRGSNFSEAMLNPTQIPRYRDMPVGIFWGENDIKICRDESEKAVRWYRQHHFNVQAKYVAGLGHERRPQVAAAFFAETINVLPKTAPATSTLVMKDYSEGPLGPQLVRERPERTSPYQVRTPQPTPSGRAPDRLDADKGNSLVFNNPPARVPSGEPPAEPTVLTPREPIRSTPSTVRPTPRQEPTPRRIIRQPYSVTPPEPAPRTPARTLEQPVPNREQIAPPEIPARLRVHGDPVGVAPMWVNLSVEIPDNLREGSQIIWTNNNTQMGKGSFKAQGLLRDPGEHEIKAVIITPDDREIILKQIIKVLAPTSSQPANS